ncbi:MAG TPA: hypothetical protein VIA80_10580 [Hyphomonadaceae bacterium]|jgi:hypothetical protein
MLSFLRKTDGLVTVEWVGISCLLVLGAIAITSFALQSADAAGGAVSVGLNSVDPSAPSLGGAFGDGKN